MSAAPDQQSPARSRAIPLGRLLVQRGLLTEEQLVQALFEQNRTGDRLGKLLIDLGFVDEPSIAMALATQHGGPLKTEYGFAMGFDPPASVEPEPVKEPPLSDEPAALEVLPEPPSDPAEHEEVTVQAEQTQDSAQAVAVAVVAERDEAQAELELARARSEELGRELVATREQLDEQRAKTGALQEQLATAHLAAEVAISALRGVTEAPA